MTNEQFMYLQMFLFYIVNSVWVSTLKDFHFIAFHFFIALFKFFFLWMWVELSVPSIGLLLLSRWVWLRRSSLVHFVRGMSQSLLNSCMLFQKWESLAPAVFFCGLASTLAPVQSLFFEMHPLRSLKLQSGVEGERGTWKKNQQQRDFLFQALAEENAG